MSESLALIPFDGPIDAIVTPPGSKSITNRALLAAALATGTSIVSGALVADDTEAMLECVRAMGAGVRLDESGTTITIDGIGGSLTDSNGAFFARQSGTTARFMTAALALGDRPLRLDADDAMRRRPMGSSFDALRDLGVIVEELGEPGCLPISICGPAPSRQTMPTVRIDGSVSSQFASGLLLAAPCLPDGLRLELTGEIVSRPYLAMTIAVMRAFGAVVGTPSENCYVVEGAGYRATQYRVEPDASAASYFFAAAAICGGSVTVEGLGSDSLQGDMQFVDVLGEMGAIVESSPDRTKVTGGPLHGVTVDFSQISDTAQTLAAVAVFADGPTSVTGIGFIRNKETDRIAAVVTELQRLGVGATEDEDGFTVIPGPTTPGIVRTYDDHRMAMSFALIGYARHGIEIADPHCVRKTFPTYFEAMEALRPRGAL